MRIRLNIGLVPNTRPNTFTVRRENAVNGTEYVRRLFPNFLSFATKLRAAEFTAPNGGQVVEETLVFDITVPDCQRNIGGGLYTIAEQLDQDCVAVMIDDKGLLIGPNAAAWGAFNPEFFFNIDGTTAAKE